MEQYAATKRRKRHVHVLLNKVRPTLQCQVQGQASLYKTLLSVQDIEEIKKEKYKYICLYIINAF